MLSGSRRRQSGTAPENGALSGGLIDDDVGHLIRAIFAHFDVVEIDAGFAQALDLDSAALVVADSADVLDAHPEVRHGDQCAGDLSAGAENFGFKGTLPA